MESQYTVGSAYRRQTKTLAVGHAANRIAYFLRPQQFDIGVPSECESAIIANRNLLQSAPAFNVPQIMIKMGVCNVFSNLESSAVLRQILKHKLKFNHNYDRLMVSVVHCFLVKPVFSENGLQQGDP